ncbi:OmpA/MotB family protein [Desulfuromonas acetexigens]|uniref:OmpA family protein n=1 Tax=Trichloromonas acetexigens TaxID=38815 RepID=A0A550JKA8_9BACT|nr:OmpA family protein [Desulfuromonas acetexigens]TRO83632.1 OmpA family protein [Desulfuromonas acetexigens]
MTRNFLPVLIALTLACGACVSNSAYQQKLDENDFITRQLGEMEADCQLVKDRRDYLVKLNGDQERRLHELTRQETRQRAELKKAKEDIARLEKVLASRSTETGAAMKEMRQTIDRLEEKNRDLEQERLAREARLVKIRETYDELTVLLAAEIGRREVVLDTHPDSLSIDLSEKILFDSGATEVKSAGLEILRRLGGVLVNLQGHDIRIEGHTDNVPISSRLREKFPSNWELSAVRAASVLHFLQEQVGLPGESLAAVGHGEFRPVADNATPEGRALNRRIRILLKPQDLPAAP